LLLRCVGDEIGSPDGDPYEVYRILFDLTFFFFVIVILLAIIQGQFFSGLFSRLRLHAGLKSLKLFYFVYAQLGSRPYFRFRPVLGLWINALKASVKNIVNLV